MTLVLHRDYETRSTCDLRKCGVHVYAADPTTDVLVGVWIETRDGEPTGREWIWYPGEDIPEDLLVILNDPEVMVTGHNAAFEAAIDGGVMGPRHGFPVPPLSRLDCTMARCAVQSLPLSLDQAAAALGLKHQKDAAGYRLMMQMCKPRKPRKGEDPTQTYWWFDQEKLARLTQYCHADVLAEIGLDNALRPLTPDERKVWELDQVINNRGVAIDIDFAKQARDTADRAGRILDKEMHEATGGHVAKATEMAKLKDWLKWWHGVELQTVTKTRRSGEEYEADAADKEAIQDLLDTNVPNAEVRRALEIRLAAGKSSVKKLDKFVMQCCADGRARGNLQYHAAGPGRWAGRGIQLQNLPRAGISEPGGWDAAWRDMQELDYETFELVWGAPLDLMSRMLRGAVIAKPDHKLIFGDYSAVEARGCVWAAGQDDMVQLFASGGKIYEETAANIFNMTVDEVIAGHKSGTNILPRLLGKVAVLGCGYGVGPAKFQATIKKGSRTVIPMEMAEKAVWGWRDVNHKVVELWQLLEDAAKAAIESPGRVFYAGPVAFRKKGNWLQMRLPSGRPIWYRRPSIKPTKADLDRASDDGVPRGRWKIHYWGVNGVTKQWAEESTWGGKLLENAIQGTCRDFLAGAILRLEASGYSVVLTVHDEAISEVPTEFGSVKEFLELMSVVPQWAPGFPLKAEGASGTRYAKG